MQINHFSPLEKLVSSIFPNKKIKAFAPLPQSGSSRRYYRIELENKILIGTFNEDIEENEAFFHFTEVFLSKNLQVPKIYAIDNSRKYYLQEYLGKENLYEKLSETNSFDDEILPLYKQVLTNLVQFQLSASSLDFSKAYPRHSFDKQSILWDLSYFKYYFLKFLDISFNEQRLEDDFHRFADYLLEERADFFMYRDFQSRNVVVKNDGTVAFVDYQGGRKGALQYDLASLLYDAKANLSEEVRNYLLNFYLKELKQYIKVDETSFKNYFNAFVLIRALQALGAYGFRGIFEQKAHFLKSIPYAIENLKRLKIKLNFLTSFPELAVVVDKILESDKWKEYAIFDDEKEQLTVHIKSFSYKKQLPYDNSGNGGGFIFDCRFLPNPGRIDKYKHLTGIDDVVKKYLQEKKEMTQFLDNVFDIVDDAVTNYVKREFKHISVNFGCTGGQHRSVYSAEQLYFYLKNKFGDKILLDLYHRELGIKK